MTLFTSLLTALFMICIVFFVLISLWLVLRILGFIFLSKEKSKLAEEAAGQPSQKV